MENIKWIDLNAETWQQISRGKYDNGQWISSEEVLAKSSKGAMAIGRITFKNNKFETESFSCGGLHDPHKFIPVSQLQKIENHEN